MKQIILPLFIITILAGCASQPTPEQICSARWISYRADRAMDEFEREIRGPLRTIRRASRDLDNGKTLGVLQIASLLSAMDTTIDRFKTSRALDDLRLVADTCDSPELIEKVFREFMEEQGASDEFINLISILGTLKMDYSEELSSLD